MEKTIDLLKDAAFEIKKLRACNELMAARLDMFDKCMTVLHTAPAYPNQGMSPDLLFEIDKHIALSEKV